MKLAVCRSVCDEAVAAFAKTLQVTFSSREKELVAHVLGGAEIRHLPKLLDADVAVRSIREELRRMYLKAGVHRREEFTGRFFDFYRAWRGRCPRLAVYKLPGTTGG